MRRYTLKKNLQTKLLNLCVMLIIAGLTVMLLKQPLGNKTEFEASGVLEKVQSVSELNTVEMYFNEIIDFKNAKMFNEYEIPFTEKSFIFTVKAKVKAGINLSMLKESDLVISDQAIEITLPEPQITSKEILSYKAYDEKDGLFNEVTNEDTLKALDEFTLKLEQQAKESGIERQSKERTVQTMEHLLQLMGFEKITVKWAS